MFKIAIVVFRECLEIALLLGVITAATRHIDKSRHYIVMGALLGIILSSFFAFFTQSLSLMFDGYGDEIFDSCIILLTAAIISWTAIWMQGYTKKIKKNLGELSNKISSGVASHFMLVAVVSATILREGAEIILFIYSVSSAENIKPDDYLLGLGIGGLLGLVTGVVLYMGLIKIAGKYIFKISTILLIIIAAGLTSQAAGILTSSGIIEIYNEPLWDSSWLIDDRSIFGKILNIITGYDSKPNVMQIIFYTGTILINILMIKTRSIITKKQNA
jgi:high-affinity iron transporter